MLSDEGSAPLSEFARRSRVCSFVMLPTEVGREFVNELSPKLKVSILSRDPIDVGKVPVIPDEGTLTD